MPNYPIGISGLVDKKYNLELGSIFDMREAKIKSQSLVILDSKYNGTLPSHGKIDIKESPFYEIAPGLLKKIFRDLKLEGEFFESSNDLRKRYSYGDYFQFVNEFIPPRFHIIYKTDTENDGNFQNVIREVLSGIDKDRIGALGINFSFEVPVHEFNYKQIVSDDFRDGLKGINVKLSYPEDRFCLYITISVESEDSKCLDIAVNFHYPEICDSEDVFSVVNKDWLGLIREKLNTFSSS